MARRRSLNRDGENLRRYAVVGAEARLLEIASEAEAIYRAFPELRARGGAAVPAGGAGRVEQPVTKRGRHMQSGAAREAARQRMQRYWAERRKAEGRGAKSPASAGGARRGARKMSAAARKRISDAQKKRWAARKKQA